MEIKKEELRVRSSDGVHTLVGNVYIPEGEARGVLHVVHGMTEHIGRYESFMREAAERGYLCFGYDNLGHGRSVEHDAEHGYIARKDGWRYLAQDVGVFCAAACEKYGAQELPYVLMGHSMGSFIVRLAAARYVSPDKLIIMGTGGPNGAAGAGLALIGLMKLFGRGKKFSPLLDKMAFGGYNKRFAGELEKAPSAWLTNDTEIRKKYARDPYCSFKFSVSAMGDLIRLTKYSNASSWYRQISKDMPILLVSGALDPVGGYSKGVLTVRDRLKRSGADVKCILYEGARHEILNDITREQTVEDIMAFCSAEKKEK